MYVVTGGDLYRQLVLFFLSAVQDGCFFLKLSSLFQSKMLLKPFSRLTLNCQWIKPHLFKPQPLSILNAPRSTLPTVHNLRSSSSTTTNPSELKRTPLYPLHVLPENGAKMVPFAGFEMPLSYSKSGGQGLSSMPQLDLHVQKKQKNFTVPCSDLMTCMIVPIVAEHHAVRTGCGLFDVSHMVQSRITGPGATDFLSRLLPSAVSTMKPYTSTLSVMLNNEGGIIDDCMITRWAEQDWYLVTNAARRQRDLAWIRQHLSQFDAQIEVMDGHGLIALQGPQASKTLQPLLDDQSLKLDNSLFFGQSLHTEVRGVRVHVARSGYTGEDGFEISMPPDQAASLTSTIAQQAGVTLVGLAARDSLRLEAGLCLYGTDLDETVGVGEAGLGWVVGKERSGFIGEERTRREVGPNIKRRRIGLLIEKGAPARAGSMLFSKKDPIGVVTSGIPSPTMANQNIAMAYVATGFHQKGTKFKVSVRDKSRDCSVVKMPFVPSNYHRPTSSS